MDNRDLALQIYQAAINASRPDILVRSFLKKNAPDLPKPSSGSGYSLFGAGKAVAGMAKELEAHFGSQLNGGFLIIKEGHQAPLKKIRQVEGDHPVLTQRNLDASETLLKSLSQVNDGEVVFYLIAGGGSALLEKLPEGISLKEMQTLTDLLLRSGAPIEKINLVRKHLSCVKGGKLLSFFPEGTSIITFVISDVLGDPLESIASGPTTPDHSSSKDALEVLQSYSLLKDTPPSIVDFLSNTPSRKPTSSVSNQSFIIGNHQTALKAAAHKARQLGFEVLDSFEPIQKDVHFECERICRLFENAPKGSALLFSGESTLTVKANGKGGRNQHLACLCLERLKKMNVPFTLLCAGTDGTDGPTDAAGGMLTHQDPIPDDFESLLNQFRTYDLLKKMNGLLKTGPTGTNVLDLCILLKH